MLLSFALIFLSGMSAGALAKKIKLPPLVGMILAGMLTGPYCLNVLDPKVLDISAELRRVALVIILSRAGLALSTADLKKAGRPALMMCAVPATCEMIGVILAAPPLLGISRLEAALTGAVLAAVSPAVVVPRMLRLMDEGYGTDKQIPQMILAGASADDVYVIVMFYSFLSMLSGGGASISDFAGIPVSIVPGALAGIVCGLGLAALFGRFHMRDTVKVIIMLSISFILLAVEDHSVTVKISGLIGIMTMGMTVLYKNKPLAARLSAKYNKLWVAGEIILFVLVGAAADPSAITASGAEMIAVLLIAMVFRMAGVFICMLGTRLNGKERLFCCLAYTPKATVQAAIGAVPLSMGLACGQTVLSAAVLAIVITAPFGAFMIDSAYKKLLKKGI